MNSYYVYEYYVIETNEVFYVGKGSGNRVSSGKRNKFCEDMKKTHNWAYRIVKDNLTEQQAFSLEKELIKKYRETTTYRLTNVTDGGEGASGLKCTDERKAKLSKIFKEKWKNPEFRESNVSIRQDPNGPYKSKEFKEKISSLTKGKLNPNYNNHWSDSQKKNLSQVRKELKIACRGKNPRAHPVICVETGEYFQCIRDAIEKHGIKDQSNILAAVDKPNRTAGKLHWITAHKN